MRKYKWFSQADFDSCVPPCRLKDMDRHTMEQFDQAREFAGVPFVINSAHRTVDHELSQGRDGTSSHVKGVAMDIRATSSRERYHILRGLLEAGFERIGIANTFIHADLDDEKSGQVIWTYT